MRLTIGRRSTHEVQDLAEATLVYQKARDASGEGVSTFPAGRVGKFLISYNGRVWDRCGKLVMEADGTPPRADGRMVE